MGDVTDIHKEVLRSAHTSAPELRGEVLNGPERRRRWSTEEKLRVLAQSMAPGSSPSRACNFSASPFDARSAQSRDRSNKTTVRSSGAKHDETQDDCNECR